MNDAGETRARAASGGGARPVAAALRAAAATLAATSDTPRLDAELLMAHALGISREALLLGGGGGEAPAGFAHLVARRARREPLAYLTGTRAFWTIELAVTPAVLIPRPDSETLIEAAIAHFRDRPSPRRILDLGTGSGALLLAALDRWQGATGTGVDASAAALDVARGNARRLGLADRAHFEHGTWRGDPSADLVLCNPPYIADGEALPADVADHEPASALYAGSDGLAAYRAIAPVLAFAPGGCACLEIGATQAPAVTALLAPHGFAVEVLPDLGARDRCLRVTRPPAAARGA